MSFATINQCANDREFIDRIAGCAAQEGYVPPGPIAGTVAWPMASATDIEDAYESAIAAGNKHPGGDPSVITDGMILAAFQADWPLKPPPGAVALT